MRLGSPLQSGWTTHLVICFLKNSRGDQFHDHSATVNVLPPSLQHVAFCGIPPLTSPLLTMLTCQHYMVFLLSGWDIFWQIGYRSVVVLVRKCLPDISRTLIFATSPPETLISATSAPMTRKRTALAMLNHNSWELSVFCLSPNRFRVFRACPEPFSTPAS